MESALSLSPFVVDIAYRTIIGVPQGYTQYVRIFAKTSEFGYFILALKVAFYTSFSNLLAVRTTGPQTTGENPLSVQHHSPQTVISRINSGWSVLRAGY